MPVINRVYSNTSTYFNATLLDLTFKLCDPGIPRPCFLLKIINTSNVNVVISYDGIYGHDIVLANDKIVLPFQECNQQPGHKALLPRGIPVYVMAENNPGKSGNIYVISYYQPVIG